MYSGEFLEFDGRGNLLIFVFLLGE